jgi:hypothetical protein
VVRPWLAVLAITAGCGDNVAAPDAAPLRVVDASAVVPGTGVSAPVQFEVPPDTRSVAITIQGDPAALYALAELTFADGVDLVALPAGAPGPAMQASYRDEMIGQMPGDLYQSIRLGTFSHVHPNTPALAVVPGPASLRVASDTSSQVAVRIAMAQDDGGTELVLNVIVVSDTLAVDPAAVVGEVTAYLAPAGLATELGQVIMLPGTAFESITDLNEPQEPPTSQSAQLPALVADQLGASPGVDVFLVESLPAGIAGLSLGTPGPFERGGYYYGVVIEPTTGGVISGRVVAHEVAHFLGLQHVQNVGVSGTVYPDPLDDTVSGADNLMQFGTMLTAGQAFVLQKSPILR